MADSTFYTTRRFAIVESFVQALRGINGTGIYNTDLGGNVHPKAVFWDEIKEFPAVFVTAGQEQREYLAAGQKNRFLSVTIRCYVKAEDPILALEGLLADIEFVVEENGRLAYRDRSGTVQMTHDILISSIDTDEGVLAPLGIGEILVRVHY